MEMILDSPCDDLQLFNEAGRCLGTREAQIIQRKSFLKVKIDDGTKNSNSILECNGGQSEENMPCRCVRTPTSSSNIGEGCQRTPDGGQGWCFLERLSDPNNPEHRCFPDAIWSKTHGNIWMHFLMVSYWSVLPTGRFWSVMACDPSFSAPPPPAPPVPFSTSSGAASPPAPPSSGSRLVLPPLPPSLPEFWVEIYLTTNFVYCSTYLI